MKRHKILMKYLTTPTPAKLRLLLLVMVIAGFSLCSDKDVSSHNLVDTVPIEYELGEILNRSVLVYYNPKSDDK